MALKIKGTGKLTYVTFIVDKSGSMASIREPMIRAFNDQLASIRKEKVGEVRVSFVQFNDQINEIFMDIPIENISGKLDYDGYQTEGMTALCDAVGKTLLTLQKVDTTEDTAHLVIIISDGQENSSRRFTRSQIKDQIKELEDTEHWTFQYIGCEADALNEAKEALKLNTYTFHKTSAGVANLSASLDTANTSYFAARSRGCTKVDTYLPEDYK